MNLDRFAQQIWYEKRYRWLGLVLIPLSWLFLFVVHVRLRSYRAGWLKSTRVGRPVIVVGNLTVGGTGKTPIVTWLADRLKRRGLRVAVICRGYGGTQEEVTAVKASSDPKLVGDEAALHAQGPADLVIAGRDRVAAARLAVQLGADVLVSDDGLQHYALHRDCSLLVVDAGRGLGNGRVLPAGPLREPVDRLHLADLTIVSQKSALAGRSIQDGVVASMSVYQAISLSSGKAQSLADFVDPVHVVTAIGNPESFLDMLKSLGLRFDARLLPDHASIGTAELTFPDSRPVLMTDKDAIKCRGLADERLWRVPLLVAMTSADEARLWSVLERCLRPQH